MEDRLELDIEYTDNMDPNTPYIVVRAYPHVGDFIRTAKGEYKIDKMVINDINEHIKIARHTAIVSPVY